VRFETKQNAGYYFIDSVEGAWNTGRSEEGGNRGYKPRYKGGYFPVPPVDHFADLRDAMVLGLEQVGLSVERRAARTGGKRSQVEISGSSGPRWPPAWPLSTTMPTTPSVREAMRAALTDQMMPKPGMPA